MWLSGIEDFMHETGNELTYLYRAFGLAMRFAN